VVSTMDSLWGLFAGFMVAALLMFVAVYVYTALTLMTVAKRLKDKQPWLAWIPIANMVLLARLAKMHWWPVLLVIGALIPVVGFLFVIALAVFGIIWTWKVCEARKRPGWWSLLVLIPLAGSIWYLVMWGILAWSKE